MIKTKTFLLLLAIPFIQITGQNTLNLDSASSARFTVTDKVWPTNIGEGDVCMWSDDKLAAFTITIDDNNESNIPFWKTMIAKYNFHFTWFVITEAASQYNVQNWTLYNDLANLGSQINGHDDRNWYKTPGSGETNPSDTDYLARLQATINTVNTNVTSGTNNCLTYAYPFGEGNRTEAGKLFIGVRGTTGILNQPNTIDYLDINSISNVHIYGNDTNRDKYILPLLDKTSKLYGSNYYRGWASTHFHYVDTPGETTTDEFLQYLANKTDLWVAGFTEVSQYSQSFATHNLTIDSNSASEIKFTLTDDMLDSAFYFPLSVKIRIDNSWASISATQNGTTVATEIITNSGNKYAIIKAVPDGGQVTLTGVTDADPAVISALESKSMLEGANLQVDFSAATTGNDAISFSTSNLPSFGILTDNGDNTGKIIFSPSDSDAGDYQNITIIANNGRSFSSKTFQLSVSPDSGGEATSTYEITPTGDGIISDAANLAEGGTNPWLNGNGIDGTTVLKIGQSASTGASFTTNAILPFKLPIRPSGKSVTAANLKINVAYLRHWISSDIDLYGLPYSTSNTITPNNFYDGTYPDANGTVTGIQDAYFVRDTGDSEPLGTEILTDRIVNSDNNGDTALVAYINAQYDAGAVSGDYIFLRLSVDATSGSTGAHYYGISDESTELAPTLSLEIENILTTTSYEETSLEIYPNPVTNGEISFALHGFEQQKTDLNIYSLAGTLMHHEIIKNDTLEKFTTKINLQPGIYIVKITNGVKSKTEKLIIQ
ncbi:T9SS type A sorting domain-containing protein [Flavicella sediminum]|uniref:T9SS type A sorting domain-containing protein n=1 Tax=Flavicella sediminum TaxID=2585141 RepID=UPI0011246A1C|nr:T9SS type A sorting domain-containing protein [Flavicella sediminum]